MVVYTTISADFYSPGPKDWSHYSLNIEAAAKQFHDDILIKRLGKPTASDPLASMNLDRDHQCLARPLKWIFPWGTVLSSHDFKGGGTGITVHYGDRHEEASKAYRKRK